LPLLKFQPSYTDFADWLIALSLSKFVQAVNASDFYSGHILFESQPNTDYAEVFVVLNPHEQHVHGILNQLS